MLLARELGPGGSERQLTEVAKSIDHARFETHVACFHDGMRGEELRAAGIPVLRLPVRSFLLPGAIAGAWQLGRYLRRHKIQVVHTFDAPATCFAVPVARMARTNVVLSSQRAHRALNPWRYNRMLRITDRHVSGVVVNCEAVRRHLIEDERVPERLIRLCYNGIDTEEFQPRPRVRPAALADASIVIGALCLLRPEKNLETLLRAFARLGTPGDGARLAIVGSGPVLGRLKALSRELGIAARCMFSPSTPHVAQWFQAIDIFVLPSVSEALSNALMEAMASGCAAIASNVGGNPELVSDGETGLLFDAGNVDELATRLQRLLEDAALRGSLAEAGARSIRERFSTAGMVERMAEIYEGFLGDGHHSA